MLARNPRYPWLHCDSLGVHLAGDHNLLRIVMRGSGGTAMPGEVYTVCNVVPAGKVECVGPRICDAGTSPNWDNNAYDFAYAPTIMQSSRDLFLIGPCEWVGAIISENYPSFVFPKTDFSPSTQKNDFGSNCT